MLDHKILTPRELKQARASYDETGVAFKKAFDLKDTSLEDPLIFQIKPEVKRALNYLKLYRAYF